MLHGSLYLAVFHPLIALCLAVVVSFLLYGSFASFPRKNQYNTVILHNTGIMNKQNFAESVANSLKVRLVNTEQVVL